MIFPILDEATAHAAQRMARKSIRDAKNIGGFTDEQIEIAKKQFTEHWQRRIAELELDLPKDPFA